MRSSNGRVLNRKFEEGNQTKQEFLVEIFENLVIARKSVLFSRNLQEISWNVKTKTEGLLKGKRPHISRGKFSAFGIRPKHNINSDHVMAILTCAAWLVDKSANQRHDIISVGHVINMVHQPWHSRGWTERAKRDGCLVSLRENHSHHEEIWENEKCCRKHEPQASVSTAFSSSPKLSRVFLSLSGRNTEYKFSISFRKHRDEKKENSLLTLIITVNVNSLFSRHHHVNSSC